MKEPSGSYTLARSEESEGVVVDVEIRAVRPEEFERFRRAISLGFGRDDHPDETEHLRAVLEAERTVAAFDGSLIVGTGGTFGQRLTVPGGQVPAAGVTVVAVLPTHRRRGILSRMMRAMVDDAHRREESVAALWASESIIYGRFGFGVAAEGLELEIERTRAVFRHPVSSPGEVRLLSRQEALETLPGIYESFRPSRPGVVDRSAAWWEHQTLHDPEYERRGYSSLRHVVYREDGEPLGYALYRVKHDWADGLPSGELAVEELVTVTTHAYAGLWSFVFGVDLVTRITALDRPVDEPLVWMLADPRRLKRRPTDSLWVRLVDVPASLAGRRYSVEGRLVLDIRDPFCPWNEGVFDLEGGPVGARCRPTDADPDLVITAGDLGSAYLGRPVFGTLLRAGIVEGDREAARLADLMFSWDPAPWTVGVF